MFIVYSTSWQDSILNMIKLKPKFLGETHSQVQCKPRLLFRMRNQEGISGVSSYSYKNALATIPQKESGKIKAEICEKDRKKCDFCMKWSYQRSILGTLWASMYMQEGLEDQGYTQISLIQEMQYNQGKLMLKA